MHKAYAFLLSRHDFAPELTMESLAEQAIDRLTEDFMEPLGHEDVCWTHMAFVSNDGQVIDLAPDDESRGLHMCVKDFIASSPADDRLQDALRFAVQIAATDMGLYGCHTIEPSVLNEGDKRIASASREELIKDILAYIPDRLAQLYKDAVGQPKNRRPLGDSWDKCSVRKHLAAQFEEFCASIVPSFSFNGSARRCRCFDLRNDVTVPEEEDRLMVLLADFHE